MKKVFTKTLKLIPILTGFVFYSSSLFAQTVYDVISDSDDHSTLLAAIDAAGLAGALQDETEQYTVFAPDNDAFDALLDELGVTAPDLLADEDLADILLYHVIAEATVNSGDLENGQLVTPMNDDNTIKITVTSDDDVYANQAMVNAADLTATNGVVHSLNAVILTNETVADVAIDNGFTTLVDAVVAAELLPTLTDPFATFTVFAPDNDAFDALATALELDLEDILELPNLADILTYHVLGIEVEADDIENGQIVDAVSPTNTLKLTKTAAGDVFVNHAEVTLADVTAENGIVHAIDAVVLPNETVIDVAIDNDFNILVQAVVAAEVMPTLINPLADFTVFAPTDDAFEALADALQLDVEDLLDLPTLPVILQYHVLGQSVASTEISNGDKVTPVLPIGTLKITVTSDDEVFVNHAQVSGVDVTSDNGIVHILDDVLLPIGTVVDAVIDNNLTSLEAALFTAELVPVLSNPGFLFTVFAPTNAAFDDLAEELDLTLEEILDLPNLADILLYHVVAGEVLSTDLTEGLVTTLNGEDIEVSLTDGVQINNANVITADVEEDNGVAHVIDAVLLPGTLSTEDMEILTVSIYPNPATDYLTLSNVSEGTYNVISMSGSLVLSGELNGESLNVEALENGTYILNVQSEGKLYQNRFIKK